MLPYLPDRGTAVFPERKAPLREIYIQYIYQSAAVVVAYHVFQGDVAVHPDIQAAERRIGKTVQGILAVSRDRHCRECPGKVLWKIICIFRLNMAA